MDKKLIFVLGGARSGKSYYAQKMAEDTNAPVLFVATAQAFDEEMRIRIERHKAERPFHWHTLETPTQVGQGIRNYPVETPYVLIDCVTVLVNNVLFSLPNPDNPNPQAAEAAMAAELDALLAQYHAGTASYIIISNEVGLGIVPEYPLSRLYRDIIGRANQQLAAAADCVINMIAGIPQVIKGKMPD